MTRASASSVRRMLVALAYLLVGAAVGVALTAFVLDRAAVPIGVDAAIAVGRAAVEIAAGTAGGAASSARDAWWAATGGPDPAPTTGAAVEYPPDRGR